jgi:hypothetical protein
LFVDPVLPPWLPEITLHDLRVGDAMATIRFRRTRRGRTRFRVLRKSGTLRILRQPPPESLNVGVVRRIAAFAAGVVRR